MTEYLIRLAQEHESFRQPELQALATLAEVDLEFLFYDKHVCDTFMIFLVLFLRPFSLNSPPSSASRVSGATAGWIGNACISIPCS
jgi:hypothetical protein